MERQKFKEILKSAMGQYQGDDYARAQRAFRGLTTVEMSKQYGQSGKTCQQILDGYKDHHDLCQQVYKEIDKL